MQDEVTKHTRKIYKISKSPKHTFGEKIREVFVEICIIVFAVTLSIWLHSWTEHRHEQKEAKKFLTELKEDLKSDIALLKENKSISTQLESDFKFILSLKKGQASDSVIGPHTNVHFLVTNFNTGRYEGFKSIGKIGTIENDKLKNGILAYYHQTIPNLISRANFINTEHTKILDATRNEIGDLSMNDFFITKKMQSMYYLLEFNYRHATLSYDETIKQLEEIVALIDRETQE